MNPRILLVEDDPTSLAFLQAATEGLPADVDAAGTLAEAAALAMRHAHALWLIDAHLPDGTGPALLARLRGEGLSTPAIAHTASNEPAEHAALRAAGFVATVAKPLPAAAWLAAIRDALAGTRWTRPLSVAEATPDAAPDLAGTAVWDDDRALAALSGNAGNVEALRRLFLDELPATCEPVVAAARARDIEGVRAALHKLRASCGFVGAGRLDVAAGWLREAPLSEAALRGFRGAVRDTLSPR